MGLLDSLLGLFRNRKAGAQSEMAGVYQVNGRIVVFTYLVTDQGHSQQAEPVALGLPISRGELCRALSTALGSSGRLIPHPARNEWAGTFAPVLKAAGVRSHKAFMQSARLVGFKNSPNGFAIRPWKNLVPKEGFEEEAGAATLVEGDVEALATWLARHFGLDLIS